MEPQVQSSASTSKTSRIGKRPVEVPKSVTITVANRVIDIKGPKGQLSRPLVDTVDIAIENSTSPPGPRRA